MASTWASSWGTSWGNSWGDLGVVVAPTVARDRSDAGPPHRKRIIYYDVPPDPVAADEPKRRKVTRRAVEAAVDVSWVGDWSVAQAMGALPKSVPIQFVPLPEMQPFDVTVIALAMWLKQEAARIEEEEEFDVELLLMMA